MERQKRTKYFFQYIMGAVQCSGQKPANPNDGGERCWLISAPGTTMVRKSSEEMGERVGKSKKLARLEEMPDSAQIQNNLFFSLLNTIFSSSGRHYGCANNRQWNKCAIYYGVRQGVALIPDLCVLCLLIFFGN